MNFLCITWFFVLKKTQLQMIINCNDVEICFTLLCALQKIPWFDLISWCGNFAERHSFRIVSGELPETMQKLCLPTKFPHQEIKSNCSIFFTVWEMKWIVQMWWFRFVWLDYKVWHTSINWCFFEKLPSKPQPTGDW